MSQAYFARLMKRVGTGIPDKEFLRTILLEELQYLNPTHEDLLYVNASFDIAFYYHLKTPARESGEAYFLHPFRVVLQTIWNQRRDGIRDIQTLVLLILHDNIEEAHKNGYFFPLKVQFDVGIQLHWSVLFELREFTKFKELGETSEAYCERLARSWFWRTLYGKFADRTDNMWTIDSMSKQQLIKKIAETEVWFPIFLKRLQYLINREIKAVRLPEAWTKVPQTQFDRLMHVVKLKKRKHGIS